MGEAYRAATEALASAIAAKDSYTQSEVAQVPKICELVAGELGLKRDFIERVKLAALVRDVGELGVPDYILLKPGPLDPDEFARMRNHAAIGANVLDQYDLPQDVVEMVRHHHEKHNGGGYPDGLEGEQIPLGSRIIAVVGVYDALVSERSYRSGWTHSEAVEHVSQLAGSSFDPAVVKAFLAVEPQIQALESGVQSRARAKAEPSGPSRAAAEAIAQANRELVSLFDVTQTLSSTLEIDEVLGLLAHKTRKLLEASTCAVFITDEKHPKTLFAKAATGKHDDILGRARARLGRGVTGKAAKNRRAYAGNYDPNDLILNSQGAAFSFKSCAVAPIVSEGELLGTVNVYDLSSGAFTRDDLRMLNFVAQQAALAVQNAKAFEDARDSALRDPLTNLRNGRFLRYCLEREMSRCSRSSEPLSILGIDLDHFKTVNDTLGHQVGDTVLREVADVFRRQVRDYDVIVRNGGDEFVVVLPGTPADEAVVTAERIRHAVSDYAQRQLPSIPDFGASVGTASYPKDCADWKSLLARADASMYRDKWTHKKERLAA
jgi:diguanylate cyclase (GGDEF)-like protein